MSADDVEVSVDELEVATEVSAALVVDVSAVLADDVEFLFEELDVARDLADGLAFEALEVLAFSFEALDCSLEEVGSEGGA